MLPVINAELRVVHFDHHRSAVFSVATCEAITTIRTLVLLYNQEHSWGLWRQQLAEATDDQSLFLSFLLNVEKVRQNADIKPLRAQALV